MAVKKTASMRKGGGVEPPNPPSGYATADSDSSLVSFVITTI